MQTHIIALLLLACALFLFVPLIKVWYFNYQRKITYTRIIKEIDNLFANTNPFLISKKARQNLPEFLYGEIEICTLLDLMAIIHPLPSQSFYDLGSGCGKAVMAVKMRYPNLKVTGIEIIPDLHKLALQKYHLYLDKNHLSDKAFEVHFIPGDFLSHDFLQADIVFINATAYEQATWQQILDKLVQLKVGAKVIITSKTLPEDVFYKKTQCMALMSWGLTSTYIYEKKH